LIRVNNLIIHYARSKKWFKLGFFKLVGTDAHRVEPNGNPAMSFATLDGECDKNSHKKSGKLKM